MQSDEEQRRMPRYRARLSVSWSTLGNDAPADALARDWGPGGLCLEAQSRPVAIDLDVQVKLPSGEVVPIAARLVWMRCVPQSSAGLAYMLGVRIIHASERWYRFCEQVSQQCTPPWDGVMGKTSFASAVARA